jgi:hypothetical protein
MAKMSEAIRSNHYRQLAIELRKLAHQARFPSARKVLIYTARRFDLAAAGNALAVSRDGRVNDGDPRCRGKETHLSAI